MTILPSVTFPIKRVSFFTITFYFHSHILCIHFHLHLCSSHSSHIFSHFIPFHHQTTQKSHETNPVTKKSTSSKKSKSKTGKSGHEPSGKSGQRDERHEDRHVPSRQIQGVNEQTQEQPEHSGRVGEQPEATGYEQAQQAKRRGKKKVQVVEEPSSKRQRVEEDDPSIYRDGVLETVTSKFETINW